jgi:hypothetical protein
MRVIPTIEQIQTQLKYVTANLKHAAVPTETPVKADDLVNLTQQVQAQREIVTH